MKAEIKQQWLDKLRSGAIPQTKNVLRDENGGMCCLGVLLDVVAPEQWGPVISGDDGIRCHSHALATEEASFIECGKRFELGLTGDMYNAERDYQTTIAHYLAFMNDSGKSFAEIADWIETNVPEETSQS